MKSTSQALEYEVKLQNSNPYGNAMSTTKTQNAAQSNELIRCDPMLHELQLLAVNGLRTETTRVFVNLV